MTPTDRKFTESHEWIKMEDDIAIVGISDYAQEAMGDVTYAELPSVGTEVEKGTECGVIESVKAASDLFAPVAGTISEVNTALDGAPDLLNTDPYEDGWVFKLRKVKRKELKDLLTSQEYEAFVKQQS